LGEPIFLRVGRIRIIALHFLEGFLVGNVIHLNLLLCFDGFATQKSMKLGAVYQHPPPYANEAQFPRQRPFLQALAAMTRFEGGLFHRQNLHVGRRARYDLTLIL
jgi:hypothetical protein